MPRTVRVSMDVQNELIRRRIPGETNNNGAIVRALREQELEDRLRRGGLVTSEMAELNDLRMMRGAA